MTFLNLSINPVFYNFFLSLSLYIKFLKIYQLNIIKKKLVKDIKIFLKKKKKKSDNMVVNVTKISQKKKKKSLFSIEKNITE